MLQIALKVLNRHSPNTVYNIKDHISTPGGELCSPWCQVCNAIDGPLSRIEYISGLWLDKVWDNQGSKEECVNTETMKREFIKTNKLPVKEEMTRMVMSLDVEKMYPGQKKEETRQS